MPYVYQQGDLALFDLDQTLINSDHRIVFKPCGNQDIPAFRQGNPDFDTLLQGSEALDAWYRVPPSARGLLTSRILCNAEKRALRRLGLMQASVFLTRPEGSPLACAVLKVNNLARILRKAHRWERIVYFEDSFACVKAVADYCKLIGMPFKGFHIIQGVALDYDEITA